MEKLEKAVISHCGHYRYVLRRSIDYAESGSRRMLFILLNPSTADAEKDDPTIRRLIGFAKREKMTDLSVVNLFAYRATDPNELLHIRNPIGIDNDRYIEEEMRRCSYGNIIAGWGSHPAALDRGTLILNQYGPLMCFGQNKDGSPKHPLYLPLACPLVEFKRTKQSAKDTA